MAPRPLWPAQTPLGVAADPQQPLQLDPGPLGRALVETIRGINIRRDLTCPGAASQCRQQQPRASRRARPCDLANRTAQKTATQPNVELLDPGRGRRMTSLRSLWQGMAQTVLTDQGPERADVCRGWFIYVHYLYFFRLYIVACARPGRKCCQGTFPSSSALGCCRLFWSVPRSARLSRDGCLGRYGDLRFSLRAVQLDPTNPTDC